MAQTTFRSAVVEDLATARNKLSRIQSQLDDMNGRAPSDRELMDCRDLANRLTPLFESLEMTTPAPMPTQSFESYRADALTRLQNFVPDRTLSRIDLHRTARTDDAAMDHFEREVVKAAKAVAADPNQGSFADPRRLRVVKETDQSGRTWTTFKGPVSEFMRPFQFPSQTVVTTFYDKNGNRLPR